MQDAFFLYAGAWDMRIHLNCQNYGQFSRLDVSTWIISKGEMTKWGLIKPGLGQGLWETFWEF